MLGQTFVYPDNTLCVNDLRRCEGPRRGSENPSESLVESGLRHLTGKTFRAGLEDAPARPNQVCDQSAARASAGGMERNSTPTKYRMGSSGPETRRTCRTRASTVTS